MDGFVAELRKIPPVTRFLCGSSLAVTVPLLMNMVSGYKLIYTFNLAIKQLQLWRLYTSFFIGGSGINYLFDLIMLYRNADQLESGPYSRRSADLAYQLLFACGSIIVATVPLKGMIFFHPLLVCLIYLSSSLAPLGAQTSLMGLVTFPVKYLPYSVIAMDLLMGGPGHAAQAIAGAVVGHFWWWGVWGSQPGSRGGVLSAYANAPAWMRNLVGEGGDIPSFKLIETDLSLAFLDIGPLSKGHALVIPKYHAAKLHELPDEHLTDVLPIAKKIALAQGLVDYNILQNNGRIAHQEVDHVHFHVIPKPSVEQGLIVGWPVQSAEMSDLKKYAEELASTLQKNI
ncbi:hypothetical protein C0991_007727 [Blastosporella zonata]|nr:hypothetical protein C0991_007727 [Blastosporella zonata]